MQYRPSLDGLRGLSVLAVVALHVRPDLLPGGWVGVDVFFVLSGWLITSILLTEHARTGAVRLGAFYLRRLLRLMPALVVTVAFAAVVVGTVVHVRHFLGDAITAVTYTEDFRRLHQHHEGSILGHTWSLAVEEQFYLLWPPLLIWWLARRRNPLHLAATAFAVSVAVSVGATIAYGAVPLITIGPLGHAPELLAGVLVAIARPRVPAWLAVVGLVGPAVIAGTADEGATWQFAGGLAAGGLLLACTVQRIATADDWMSRSLGWKPLAWIGRRSYGIYLYHYPMIYLVNAELHHGVRQPAIVLGSIAVAALSYQFIELPFLRIKKRLQPVPTA